MEMLGILEKKIEGLVSLIKELREENRRLLIDNASLREKVSQLEGSLLKESERLREENTTVKKVIDDLISDIDLLIEAESR